MAYTKGELKYDDNSGSLLRDNNGDFVKDENDDYVGKEQFYLPHSCDNWVIGGIEEAKLLLEELKSLIEQYESLH